MVSFKDFKAALGVSLWFVFLTFPIMVIKVDPIERIIRWRWENALYVAIASFLFYLVSRLYKMRQSRVSSDEKKPQESVNIIHTIIGNKKQMMILCFLLLAIALFFPHVFSVYQTNVMTTALMYVVLGLGLNIVVGMAGLLDLGFVAFYAVGAYTYALLNFHFQLGFWAVLPIGGGLAAIFGILLGFPVLRLRGLSCYCHFGIRRNYTTHFRELGRVFKRPQWYIQHCQTQFLRNRPLPRSLYNLYVLPYGDCRNNYNFYRQSPAGFTTRARMDSPQRGRNCMPGNGN